MYDTRFNPKGISLIMSLGCNLNCEYCWIAESKHNEQFAEDMQLKNIEALKNGTFLKNVLAVLKRLEKNPENIDMFSFWGQEPTLTLQYYTQNIKDWTEAFPNLNHYDFSTNGMANADKIIEFVDAVEENAKNNTLIGIQFSYDGEESTNNIRKGNSSIIKNNIIYIFQELSKRQYKKVDIRFSLHAVLSMDMMYSLNTNEKLYNYYKEMDEYLTEICSYITSNKLHFDPKISLNFENPYFAGKVDGLAAADFIRRTKGLDFSNFTNNLAPVEEFLGILADIGFQLCGKYNNSIESLKDICKTGRFPEEPLRYLFCSNNITELKIMYDGTLINCQNYIYDKNIENIPIDDSIINGSKRSLVNHHYFVNALTDPIEEVEKNITFFLDLRFKGMSQMLSHTYNLMYCLALAGQIDQSYLKDKEKLLRHGYIIASVNNCAYNHLIETGTHFSKSAGYIRRYCNGIMDIVDDIIFQQQIKKEINCEKGNFYD